MHLIAEGHEPIPIHPDQAEVAADWVARLSYSQPPGFFTVERGPNDYMQVAGSGLRMTVEWRSPGPLAFRHERLGRHPDDPRKISINTRAGILTIQRNEVLAADEARAIFAEYIANGKPPSTFHRRDISETFM